MKKNKIAMKKDTSKLISEKHFWEIIEASDKGRNLVDVLSHLTIDEIFGYRYWWNHFVRISYTSSLWAVADVILNGCSDDGFDYFRFWLIARGQTVFYNALKDPDTLCDEFVYLLNPKQREYPQKEQYDYAIYDVLKRLNIDYDKALNQYNLRDRPYPKIELDWDGDSKECMAQLCPRTVAKWWRHEYFYDL